MTQNFLDQLRDGSSRGSVWAEVESEIDLAQVVFSEFWLGQDRREPEVTTERLKHMLPWAHGGFVAHWYRPAFFQSAHAIGHDAVRGPVAAADHIARARTRDFDLPAREERTPITADHDFRRRFARAVRVVSAQRVGLTIAVKPFAVFVTFVTCNADRDAGPIHFP